MDQEHNHYSYQRVSIREDTSVKFWNFTPEQLATIKLKYDDTGRRLSFRETLSHDGRQQTWTHIWADIDSWIDYNTEFSSAWEDREQYNNDNDIITLRMDI